MYTDGREVMLCRRARPDGHPGVWAFPGGKIEEGENPLQAAIRESWEEIRHVPRKVKKFDFTQSHDVEFTTFRCATVKFTPELDHEHTQFMWASIDNLPTALHPGAAETLEKYRKEFIMPWSKDNLPPSTKNKNWSAEQVEVFVKTANAILEKTGNEGEAIATGIKQAEGAAAKENAKQFPSVYYCRHMQPGICRYDNETVLVDTDAIKKMMPTAIGKPVYIQHQDVDLENLKEEAAGYIVESFYNPLDGWCWFKFLAIDDEMHAAISDGFSVSNAYIPTEVGDGGTKNNCPYDREYLNGRYTHLAVVPNPRYEGARIYTNEEFKAYQDVEKRQLKELQNSKPTQPKKGKHFMEFFKNKREKTDVIDKDTIVPLPGGGEATFGEMLNAVEKDMQKEKDKQNEDKLIKCGEEEMPLKELINRYMKMSSKKNEDEDDDKDKEKSNKKAKKNEDEDDKKEKENMDDDDYDEDMENEDKDKDDKVDEKKNDNFDELRNAHNRAKAEPMVVETSMDKLERGREMFSK